jgi:hypothetical protein
MWVSSLERIIVLYLMDFLQEKLFRREESSVRNDVDHTSTLNDFLTNLSESNRMFFLLLRNSSCVSVIFSFSCRPEISVTPTLFPPHDLM